MFMMLIPRTQEGNNPSPSLPLSPAHFVLSKVIEDLSGLFYLYHSPV